MNLPQQYIKKCLELAEKGMGNVSPNPMVGSVIVYDGKIIGQGFHQKFGGSHAEVNAINSVSDQELLKKSTLYVNLEPCSHFGKTPPCADLIISKKIPKVVIGSYDPNPKVSGKGIQKLKDAGIEVEVGILKEESDYLNRRFLTFQTKHRPFLILKWAESEDGYMAGVEKKQLWLTNEESKILVHKWRSEEQAFLVGKNTVAIDDPELTTRLWTGKNPLRITIDRNLELNQDRKIFNSTAPTIVFNEKENSSIANVERVKIEFGEKTEEQILEELYKRNILSLVIEGGKDTLTRFIEKNLWDEARIFSTKHILGKGIVAPKITGVNMYEKEIGTDKLIVINRASII